MNRKMIHVRIAYLMLFGLFVVIEICIALFIHDRWIRPYLGDVIVIWTIYSFAQIFLAKRCHPLIVCAGVFVFAILVEGMQGIHIVELLGLQQITFFRILIGTQFDWKDILCYTIGSLLLAVEILIRNEKENDSCSIMQKS